MLKASLIALESVNSDENCSNDTEYDTDYHSEDNAGQTDDESNEPIFEPSQSLNKTQKLQIKSLPLETKFHPQFHPYGVEGLRFTISTEKKKKPVHAMNEMELRFF